MNESFDTVTESTSVLDTAKNFGLDHKEAIVAGAASAATISAVWAGMAFLNRKKAAKEAVQRRVAALVLRTHKPAARHRHAHVVVRRYQVRERVRARHVCRRHAHHV